MNKLPRALHVGQVNGAGTGVRRHPLFFLGFKMSDQAGGEGGPLRRWLRRRRTAAAAARAGKQQASTRAAAASAPTVARRSSEQSLRDQWQAAGATSTPGSLAGDEVAGRLEEDWAAQYYGSFGSTASPALRSPQLPSFGSNLPAAVAPDVAEAASPTASSSLPLPRKPTSLRLEVLPELPLPGANSGSSGSTAREEEAEGLDVAAERARAEALWQQW